MPLVLGAVLALSAIIEAPISTASFSIFSLFKIAIDPPFGDRYASGELEERPCLLRQDFVG
jgi:hypothetical protein